MDDQSWQDILTQELRRRDADHLLRRRTALHPIDAAHVRLGDKICVNFSGNDYLGLSHHPKVIQAVQRGLHSHGFGSGAAALISGYTDLHASAEESLAKWKGTERAVLLGSGYQANFAAVQTVAALGELHSGGVRFLVDKLAHASLIDAVRASHQPFRIFPHNHLPKLQRLLDERAPDQLQVVLTESIFSMDGDAADLRGLAALKQSQGFFLLLDEAHASGVYGPNGSGLASEMGLQSLADVTVVTLSKALGCVGGAVCASKLFCDALLNFGRAFIYSTNLPASTAAGVEAAIGVMREEPQRQERVRSLARRVRAAILAATPASPRAGSDPAGARLVSPSLPEAGDTSVAPANAGTGRHGQTPRGEADVAATGAGRIDDSPIIPVIYGNEKAAIEAAESLRQLSLMVLPVRPPTVPKGTSRLRVTVSSDHTDEEVLRLIEAIRRVARNDPPAG